MAAKPAVPMEGPDDEPRGVFLAALNARRDAVLARLDPLPAAPRLAELVFDLFAHVALDADARLDGELVSSFARRHDLDPGDMQLPLPGGGRFDLAAALAQGAPVAAWAETINALFTRGYVRRLEALSHVERRNFTLRVVAMLPGIERLGPFVLSHFIDQLCAEDDALRFWQIYVDRVAAEVSKRTQVPRDRRDAWLLSTLLRLYEEGPTLGQAGAWVNLKRHVNRVLQTRRHRWRFIRSLVEGCHDPRMLIYICTSPAMVEDPEVVEVFLTRGNSKLVSCALFTMQVHAEMNSVVDRVIEHFRGRPLPEVGERIVELYAQLHLPADPVPSLRRLAVGLRELVRDRTREGPVEALLQAVDNDARGLRQIVLLSDLVEDGRAPGTPQVHQLLERAVRTWLQTFTPSGVDHPLNDAVFRRAVRRALRSLLATDEHAALLGRLAAFGDGLPEHVQRWLDKAVGTEARDRMLGRFLAVYGDTLVRVARALYRRAETRAAALGLYALVVRLFTRHGSIVDATGWFGAMEYALPAVFPTLGPDDDPARLREAAELIAQVEEALAPREDTVIDAPLVFPRRPGEDRPGDDARAQAAAPDAASGSSGGSGALIAMGIDREHPLRAPVEVVRRDLGGLGAVARAYLGLDLLAGATAGLQRLFGVARRGEITLTDREVVVTSERRLAGRIVERTGDSHALHDLTAVNVRQRMRGFYLVLGTGALVTAGLLGGHLLFVGLRGADHALALGGLGVIALGVAFDAVATRLAFAHRNSVVLELRTRTRPRHLRLLLDVESGAEVLDAFMANDAERRELQMLEKWSSMDVDWEEVGEDGF
mgnify:CR=1 FL=1